MSVAEGVHYTLLCNLFVYTSDIQGCEHCSGGEHTWRPWMVVCEAGKWRGYNQEGGVGRVGQTSPWRRRALRETPSKALHHL